jgi:hypothetical protein
MSKGQLRLLHLPDGFLSHYYPMIVGKSYTILDDRNGCFVVLDDAGEKVTIAHERFEPFAPLASPVFI